MTGQISGIYVQRPVSDGDEMWFKRVKSVNI